MQAATDEFRQEMDPTFAFIQETCERGESHTENKKELYNAYRVWARINGREQGALNSRKFGKAVDGMSGIWGDGSDVFYDNRAWHGITLRKQYHEMRTLKVDEVVGPDHRDWTGKA